MNQNNIEIPGRVDLSSFDHRRRDIRLAVRMNWLYHEYRENFFVQISQFGTFLSMFLGSGAALNAIALAGSGTLLGLASKDIGVCIGLVIVFVNGIILAFRVNEKTAEHRDLRRAYGAIWSRMATEGFETEEHFIKYETEIQRLESREPPPVMRALRRAERIAAKALQLQRVG